MPSGGTNRAYALHDMPYEAQKRFWDALPLHKFDLRGDGCWPWYGPRNVRGLPRFSCEGKWYYAHRIMWAETNDTRLGAFDQVRHACRNRLCCRPSHLEVYHRCGEVGGRRPGVGLTMEVATAIRAAWADGGVTQMELAKRFGVSQPTVSHILRNLTWRPKRPEESLI